MAAAAGGRQTGQISGLGSQETYGSRVHEKAEEPVGLGGVAGTDAASSPYHSHGKGERRSAISVGPWKTSMTGW